MRSCDKINELKQIQMKNFTVLKFFFIAAIATLCFSACEEENEEPVNQSPSVVIENPENNATFIEGDTVTLTCQATDNEDGQLEGEKITWSSSTDGEIGQGAMIKTTTLTINQHLITVKVHDSENQTATDTVSITILDDVNPSISITSPADNTTFMANEPITFTCVANDAEDGELSGASIQWSSDTDGNLGIGSTLPDIYLTAGTHQIEAKATDSYGNTSTANISLIISDNTQPEVSIQKPFLNHTYLTNTEIEMTCTATDEEDGELSETSVSWSSSIDGDLGSGTEITATLSPGNHTIIATASDSEAANGFDTTYIDVVSGPLTLEIMVKWMEGAFSSEEQAETSSDPYHYDVRRKTAVIWNYSKDGYWLYLEQAYATSQNNPYFQRIYHFYYENDVIKNTIYALPNPGDYVGSWATPEDFDQLTVEDLIERPNCGLTFETNSDHIYGTTSGTACSSSISGVEYMTSEQWIYSTEWHSYDLGYNAQGVIVMGPYSPYIFDKVIIE